MALPSSAWKSKGGTSQQGSWKEHGPQALSKAWDSEMGGRGVPGSPKEETEAKATNTWCGTEAMEPSTTGPQRQADAEVGVLLRVRGWSHAE